MQMNCTSIRHIQAREPLRALRNVANDFLEEYILQFIPMVLSASIIIYFIWDSSFGSSCWTTSIWVFYEHCWPRVTGLWWQTGIRFASQLHILFMNKKASRLRNGFLARRKEGLSRKYFWSNNSANVHVHVQFCGQYVLELIMDAFF